MTTQIIPLFCIFLVSLTFWGPPLTAQTGTANVESARRFVQDFYGWYIPQTLRPHAGQAWDLALKDRPQAFSPQLFQALKEDSEAQARTRGFIVGLDFDPFLNSQDPCDGYEVGKIRGSRDEYQVEIYGVCSGKRKASPDAVCVVRRSGDDWLFVNVLYPSLRGQYPNSADLLTTLGLLQAQRSKNSH